MRSVMLAAVHYGELQDSPAQEVVQRLVSAKLVQQVVEVIEQPEIETIPDAAELVAWRHRQGLLEKCWRAHLGKPNSIRDLATGINESLYRVRLRWNQRFRASQWRTRQIEKFVTAKHIRAWQQFVESPHSTLAVVESDASLTTESLSRVTKALAALDTDWPVYINLAGGLSRASIFIDHVVASETNGMTLFTRPVTNTSCAYAMNRNLAYALLSFQSGSPEASTLGIDWLFNAFFLDQTSRGRAIECLHVEPPALMHGSLTGVTTSWHPSR